MNEEAEESRGEIHQIVSQGCRTCDYWDAENYHCMLNIPIHSAYPCRITDKIIELGYRKPVDRPDREKIDTILKKWLSLDLTYKELLSQLSTLYNKGEPPLLTPEELRILNEKWEAEYEDVEMTDAEWEEKRWGLIAQAQWDICVKHYA